MNWKRAFCIVFSLMLVLAAAGCTSSPAATTAPANTAAAPDPSPSGGADPSPDTNAETYVFKLGHQTPNDNFYDQLGKKFAELVSNETDGRITINIFPNGELGYDSDLIQAMQFGTVDFGVVTCSPVSNFEPQFGVLDLPYIFTEWEQAVTFAKSDVAQELLAEAQDENLTGLGLLPMGFRGVTNNIRPIYTPEDLKGIKLRVIESASFIKTFEDFGVVCTALSWGEVYTAISQKTIDGQENYPDAVRNGKMHEVQKYYSLTKHMTAFGTLMASSATMAKLSEADQAAIKKAADGAITYMIETITNSNAEILADLNDNLGLAVNEVTDIEAFKEKAVSAREWFKGEFGDEYINKIAALFQ